MYVHMHDCAKRLVLASVLSFVWLSACHCDADASGGSSASSDPIWKVQCVAQITQSILLPDGGALVSTACCESDGVTRSGGNTIYRFDSTGNAVWKYPAPDGWKIGLRDASSTGDLVLVRLISSRQPLEMKLVVLDRAGKPIRTTAPMRESNWVWMSPDGAHLLRWVADTASLVCEASASGNEMWAIKDLRQELHFDAIDFIDPVLQAGFVLVGDSGQGTVCAVSVRGKLLFTMRGLKWYPAPASPIAVSSEGMWLAAKSTDVSCSDAFALEWVAQTGSAPNRSELESTRDMLSLVRIFSSDSDLKVPGLAAIVWKQACATWYIQGRRVPRQGAYGGPVIALDLFEAYMTGKGTVWLTALTGESATTRVFGPRGALDQEIIWPVPNIGNVADIWLLSLDRLLVRQNAPAQMLRVIGRNGEVVWERSFDEPLVSVSLGRNRDRLLVATPNRVEAYQLD